MKSSTFLLYLTQFFMEWEFWEKSFEENQKHILCSLTVFKKLWHSWDNVEKYCRA